MNLRARERPHSAALSGSHPKAPGLAGGYLLLHSQFGRLPTQGAGRLRSDLLPFPMPRVLPLLLLAVAFASACGNNERATPLADSMAGRRVDSVARARQDSINRASPGYIVDSILPVEEEVRRFRAAIGGVALTRFADASDSRNALVARLAAAIAANDDRALQRTRVTAREFIDLVYPESPYTKAPFRQAPGLVWTLIEEPSNSGRRRLLSNLGGRPLAITRLSCGAKPETQGRNRLWNGCTVRYTSGGDAPRDGRLFGAIIERDGRFKFMSLSNQY